MNESEMFLDGSRREEYPAENTAPPVPQEPKQALEFTWDEMEILAIAMNNLLENPDKRVNAQAADQLHDRIARARMALWINSGSPMGVFVAGLMGGNK